jgi:hypothetical protein
MFTNFIVERFRSSPKTKFTEFTEVYMAGKKHNLWLLQGPVAVAEVEAAVDLS